MKLTSLFSFLNKMRNSFVKFYYKNSPKNLKLEKAGNSNQDLFHTATLLFSSDCNFLADLSFTRPRLSPIFLTRLHETTRPKPFLIVIMSIFLKFVYSEKATKF